MNKLNKKISLRLALARKQKGMTQAELAKKLDIGISTLQRYESGLRAPTHEFLLKFEKEDFDIIYILTGSKTSRTTYTPASAAEVANSTIETLNLHLSNDQAMALTNLIYTSQATADKAIELTIMAFKLANKPLPANKNTN